ncbi:MAG: endolytic transglycosylase MltG [Firmicutes bacterium]|nr:endolytic transglycosylase MltG [Bacillota bacterium]
MAKSQHETKTSRPRLLVPILIVLLLLVTALSTGAYIGYGILQDNLGPVSDDSTEFLVTVPQGASSARIGDVLEEAGVIKSALVFRLYLRYHELDGRIQAGDYMLSPSSGLEEIVDKLVSGDAFIDTFRFTVPEGLFISDIAARLANRGIVDEERFLELANDLSNWDYWFVEQIPEGLEFPLEGYLFPDTYEMRADVEDRERAVINTMLRGFDRVFTEEMREATEAMGMTVHEIVTLASIVEKEAVVADERPLVAAAFHNRLIDRAETYFMLESCATINYILQDFSIRDISPYRDIDSPYNTYMYPGLPPGPIAGPGAGSLRATVFPADVDYKFFVAKDDGSSEHYFAATYAEHVQNARRARENRQN